MAITSTKSLLDLLENSQLLTARDIEKVKAAAGKYDSAKALARALVAGKALTRWQAGQLLAGRGSFTLGKYRLVDLLGRGGMGSVFLASHKTMNRRVALKIISKQTGRDPEQLERFLEEARRIAALDHPNIVRAYDVDHEGERYFLVLEYVEGRDLQQLVESDGPLEVSRAARFVRQAALGLTHAHDRKMIHCDIKPANLIVNDQDVVKILDMGMARLVTNDGSSSDSNENIVGTIDYIAPEQALEADDLDHRVDLYSLGCTLYFLLTSRPPFGEGTLPQRILRHQTQNPPPISESRSGVPEGLVEVCLKMMAKKPEQRYQTAAEVAQALEPWAGGETLGATGGIANEADGPAVVELIGDDDSSDASDDGGVKIAVADSGSFSTRAGASRGKRPVAAKKSVSQASTGGGLGAFFGDPRKKWATIVVAGIVLLSVVGGGLAWMLWGGDRETASETAAKKTVASAEAGAASASSPAVPVSDGSLDLGGGLEGLDAAFGANLEATTDDATADAMPEGAAQGPSESENVGEPARDVPVVGEPDVEEAAKPQEDELATQEPGKEPQPADIPIDMEEPESEPKTGDEKQGEEGEEQVDSEPAKEPEEKPAKVEPLKDFPGAVSLPILSDSDAAGEASKAPLVLGAIHGAATENWQMLLVGGESVLKGGRKFVLARTDADAAKAAWAVQLDSGDSAAGQEKVARLWREGETLRFQWADDASGATANYLRNCFLQLRVSGENKYTSLTEPIQVEPIGIDLIRGQANSSTAIKWAPDDELLRFKFAEIEGIEKANFAPAEPVTAKTQVALNFVRTDQYGNDSNAVTLRILPTAKKTSLNVDLRLIYPLPRAFQAEVRNFNEQQLGGMVDRLGNQRTELAKKKEHARGEEANKISRDIDTINAQIWYLDFFLKAHKKAAVHYQVVADVGGQELVLVTTK